MHGSGSDGGHQQPLGSRIKAEVESALRLLFKNVPQHAISTELQTTMVVYLTELPCETTMVSLAPQEPEVSEDPVTILRRRGAVIHPLDLLPMEAPLAQASPCEMAPALCFEPVLDDMDVKITPVSFDNLTPIESKGWTTEAFEKPETKLVSPQSFQPKVLSFFESLPSIRTLDDPRFYALPIKKVPIPPHRFSPAVREAFRKALAEKANTRPDNVQLRIVFERMDMTLFSGLQQDEQGNLLCTPKNELLGRNRNRNKNTMPEVGNVYLVYGFRLDNKEDIRAIVPADGVKPKQMNYKRNKP